VISVTATIAWKTGVPFLALLSTVCWPIARRRMRSPV